MKIYYPKDSKGNIIGFRTPEKYVYDESGKSLTDKLKALSSLKIPVDNSLSSTSTNPVQNKIVYSEISTLKKSVSDGKTLVANTITNQGVQTATDSNFSVLAANINSLCTNKYNKGVSDADNRVNTGSTNYKTGYNNGVSAADGRSNPNSTNYKSGYNKGVSDADGRSNPDSTNYKSGYNNGYSNGYNNGVSAADNRSNPDSTNYKTGYNNGVSDADNRANSGSVNYQSGCRQAIIDHMNSYQSINIFTFDSSSHKNTNWDGFYSSLFFDKIDNGTSWKPKSALLKVKMACTVIADGSFTSGSTEVDVYINGSSVMHRGTNGSTGCYNYYNLNVGDTVQIGYSNNAAKCSIVFTATKLL